MAMLNNIDSSTRPVVGFQAYHDNGGRRGGGSEGDISPARPSPVEGMQVEGGIYEGEGETWRWIGDLVERRRGSLQHFFMWAPSCCLVPCKAYIVYTLIYQY
jgi:hypothetical protein